MNDILQGLINAPLADPLKPFSPGGKRRISRGPRPVYEGQFARDKLSGKSVAERKADDYDAKITALLDYYAGTDVPFDRVAAHAGLTAEKAEAAMRRRGREA